MDYTIKARPTIYRGTQMRSRLEARFAQRCDAIGVRWEYEPVCFAGRAGQYLPDFRLTSGDAVVYVDVKPTSEAAMEVVDGPMRIVWESELDAVLAGTHVRSCPYEGDRWEWVVLAPPIASWHRLLRSVDFTFTDLSFEDRYTIIEHGRTINLDLCFKLPHLELGDRWTGRELPPADDGAWHLVGECMPRTWAPRLIELDEDLIVTDHYRGQTFITHEAADLLDRITYSKS